MSIELLTDLSRYYGANTDYVLAGGGNTSWKNEETLYVKGSGMALANVVSGSFVKMDRKALAGIWKKQYPAASAERESAVLADMMAARKAGEEQKRPSVEALLHDIMPFAFVVHLHPAFVNGITCSRQGEAAMTGLFGQDCIWIPSTNPGYILSQTVRLAMDAFSARHGKNAAVIFLQNHGVFAGDNTVDGIKNIYGNIMRKIGERVQRQPDFSDEERTSNIADAPVLGTLAELSGGTAILMRGAEVAALVRDHNSFLPVSSAFTPDHIVYSGSDPLFSEAVSDDAVRQEWNIHVQRTGRKPKIIAVRGLGVVGAAETEKAARLALDLFRDTIRVAAYTASWGGPRFMTRDQIDFINNWEVERFRGSVAIKE